MKVLKVMFRWGCDLVIEYLLSIYSIYPKFDLYHCKIKILQKFSDEKCLNLYYKFKLNTLVVTMNPNIYMILTLRFLIRKG